MEGLNLVLSVNLSTRDLLDIAELIRETDAGLRSLSEPWADTTSPAGRMVLTVFAGIAEFERALELLCAYPRPGALWRSRRRFPLRRFPYSIIYYVMGEELRVIALAHHRRKPGYWTGRK